MTQPSHSSINKKRIDLDSIFIEIGDFGLFQVFIYALMCMPIFLISWFTFEFVFTAGYLDYRCKVPECDSTPIDDYSAKWTRLAIPHSHNILAKCLRYESIANATGKSNCNEMLFNTSYSVSCNEFIYNTDEVTILREFDLTCEANEWKLALVGTTKNVAELLMLPFCGMLSDRYGRRKLLIFSLMFCGIFGIVMAFSAKYWIFVLLEFVTGIFSSGIYNVIFVLGMEMVSPSKRVLGGALIAFLYSLGQVLLGLIAMKTLHFRKLLLALYLPTFVVLTYIWMIPESVRWLLSKGRRKHAVDVIVKAARMNKKPLTEVILESLTYDSAASEDLDTALRPEIEMYENTFLTIFHTKSIFNRLGQCSFCWFGASLVYYGLSIQSVNLHGDKFVNFVMFSLAEFPPIVICYFFLDKIGRKGLLCGSFLVSGLASIAPVLLDLDHNNVSRLYILGLSKCAITIAYTILYVYTTELFSTNLRQSAMSICTIFACLGGMLAPQTQLLMKYTASLPFVFFSGFTITSGVVVVLFPETTNRKLPDTVKDL